MDKEKLLERERKLEREAVAWRSEKIELQREIPRLKAEEGALKKQVHPLKVQVEGLRRAMISLQLAIGTYKEQLADLELEIKGANGQMLLATEQFHEMTAKVERLKGRIDAKLGIYEAREQKRLTARLDELKQQIQLATEELKQAKTSLLSTEKQQRQVKKDSQAEKVSLEAQEAAIGTSLLGLTDKVDELEQTKLKLESEITELDQQKASLEKQVADFRVYEKRATKVLEAKDQELQEREKSLKGQEHFIKTQRSFLPPR